MRSDELFTVTTDVRGRSVVRVAEEHDFAGLTVEITHDICRFAATQTLVETAGALLGAFACWTNCPQGIVEVLRREWAGASWAGSIPDPAHVDDAARPILGACL